MAVEGRLDRADLGLTTVAVISVSESFSSDWQPGIESFRTAGSLSAAQTLSRGAGIRYSPDISMVGHPLRRLRQFIPLF